MSHRVHPALRMIVGAAATIGLLGSGWVPAMATGELVPEATSLSADAAPTPEPDQPADPGAAATPEGEATPQDPGPDAGDPAGPESTGSEPAAPESTDPAPDASDPAADDNAITPFVVPAPGTTSSVITVKVGGVRTSLTQVAGLAGVTLRLYDGNASGPNANPRTDSWATCVSDADGDCNFTVPNTNTGGTNRDARFWIKQSVAPSGYLANATLKVGDPSTSAAYQFRTGTQLRSGQTYTSTEDFMIGSGNGSNVSGGIWQSSRVDPASLPQCGLDVALVLDLSGSVSPYISNLRSAASTFVDSLTGTPSSMSLFTFSSVAPAPTGANLGLTPVSTTAGAQTVKSRIATYTASGTTNWDRGIYQVAAAPTHFDLAVVITDGDPTVYANNEGPGSTTRFREVENGIFSANAVRAQGTRVVAVGVGAGVSGAGDNLKAISGPILGSDYFQSTDYAAAGAALRALALGNCNGSVSVVKQVVPSGNIGEVITGAQPAANWNFTATSNTAGVTPGTQSGTTGTGTGAVNFPLTYAGGTTSGSVTVAEAAVPGYDIVTQSGKRAVCRDVATGNAVTVTNDADNPLGFRINVPSNNAISCMVYNRAPVPQSTVIVAKQWVVNGKTFADGDQPLGLTASLGINGTPQGWGVTRSRLTSGAQVALSETSDIDGRDLCHVDSARLTAHNGSPLDLPVPQTVTLDPGDNTYTITNTVTCTSELTLDKKVQGGDADPTEWTLGTVAPDGALPGPNGVTGSPGATAEVTSNVWYPLVESGNPLYLQTIRPGGVPVAPSTGSWQCEQIDASGTVIAGFNDGINGGVTVPLGYRVQCSALNQTASLTLVKEVVNDDGGTNVPSDWTLTATPTGTVPDGVVAQDVTGSSAGTRIDVRPGTTYAISESGPGGYTQESLRCTTGPDDAEVDATEVTLEALDEVTCVIVNDDQPAQLTLVKEVENGETGATAVPGDWTLSATGPTSISGVTEGDSVTAAEVSAGEYVLSEDGPDGYDGSAWTCTGGDIDGSTLTLTGGDEATCTITNTAIVPTLTLVKDVDNGTTGADAVPVDWTLTATGPATVTGPSGDPAITAAPVEIGTYDLSEDGPDGYDASDWVCTGTTDSTEDSVTLALGDAVVCTVTNTAQAPHLTLVKEVDNDHGGTRTADDFPLTATSPGATVTGVTGDTSITDVAVPLGTYTLSESSPDTIGYEFDTLVCIAGEEDLGVSVENPELDLALGMDVTCTFTNADKPATLTLLKEVDPADSGSEAVPSDWTLTATAPEGSGTDPITGNGGGGTGGVRDVTVSAGDYTLTESGPAGFDPGDWVCTGAVVTDGVVAVKNGGVVECTVTNTAQTPHLTLVKEVDPGELESADPATSWTLAAAGPSPVSGATGSATVTDAAVKVGSYDLTESGGPAGYDASDWECMGGTLDGASVTVTEGADVVCTITNTARTPQWTVSKISDPLSGSTVEFGDTITYTVTVAHTGGVAPSGVVITDDLTDVLDDAVLDAAVTVSTGTFTRGGTDLVWTIGTLTGTQTLTYSVVVGDHDDAVLHNVVTVPSGATCDGTCETTHRTDRWELAKSSDPASGSTVDQGQTITYTLSATNTGAIPVTDAVARDDLTEVLNSATLVGPLDPALSFDDATKSLTWMIPEMDVDTQAATVSYSVRVNDDAYSRTLRNVVTPDSPGGECPVLGEGETDTCTTEHHAGQLDLQIAKAHTALAEGAVDSEKGNTVDYIITVTNVGADPVTGARVIDELPPALTLVDGSLVLPPGWTSALADGVLTLTYDGVIEPGDSVELTYTAGVGRVPRAAPTGAYLPIDNTACVQTDGDDNPTNNCAADEVPVKSVAIDVAAVCVSDTPIVTYDITPTNLTEVPRIAIIWWTEGAYAAHDPSIDAADTAGILADGASRVDDIAAPSGWVSGDRITGQVYWPGTTVNAEGIATDWPGWTQLADGSWLLDPAAPFYELRGNAVVEVRINPTTDAVVAYPPATPQCHAGPPTGLPIPPVVTPVDPTGKTPAAVAAKSGKTPGGVLPRTGSEVGVLAGLTVALILSGAALMVRRRMAPRRD